MSELWLGTRYFLSLFLVAPRWLEQLQTYQNCNQRRKEARWLQEADSFSLHTLGSKFFPEYPFYKDSSLHLIGHRWVKTKGWTHTDQWLVTKDLGKLGCYYRKKRGKVDGFRGKKIMSYSPCLPSKPLFPICNKLLPLQFVEDNKLKWYINIAKEIKVLAFLSGTPLFLCMRCFFFPRLL